MLKKVTIVQVVPNREPKFVKTQKVLAVRDGDNTGESTNVDWEMVNTHDTVHIMVDNTDTKELLLVRQVRIPVLVNDDSFDGVVYEACAGIIDKDISIDEIAREEILEELGYDIPISDITFFKQIKSSVGSAGRTSHLYFAEVKEQYKVNEGGGIHGEDIEVVRIPYNEVDEFIVNYTIHTDAVTLLLIMQWLRIK